MMQTLVSLFAIRYIKVRTMVHAEQFNSLALAAADI